MANLNFDLDRLLTGVSNRPMEVQRQPIPGSPSFSGDFSAQTANSMKASLGNLVRGGRPTQAQQLNQAEAKYRVGGTIEDKKKLIEILVMRGDREAAAKIASEIQAMNIKQDQKINEDEAQTGFIQFIADNYPTYLGLATSGTITPSNWGSFLKQEKGSESSIQFGSTKTFKDDDDNLYFGTQARNPSTGEVETKLSPIGDAPETPSTGLEEVGAYGQTSSERDKSKIKVGGGMEEVELFAKRRNEASDIFSSSAENAYVASKMLTALDGMSTGGFVPATIKAMTDVIGITPSSVGDFEIKAQEMMIAKLSAFGANPTEGEARRAAALVASIRKSKGLNRKLVMDYQQEMKRRGARAEYLLTSDASIQGYNDFTTNQYKTLGKPTKKFGDLE